MATNLPNDYFETDQIKHAVALWKLVRRAGECDFDVLKFGRDWYYAETVLVQCLASEHEAVSTAGLELMQFRMQFEQQHPERAAKLGAGSSASRSAPSGAQSARPAATSTTAKPSSGTTANAPKDAPAAPTKYLKSLR
jgi:hypothetical protein